MIGYLKGSVSHLFAEYCFLDVQGVGYRIFIPFSTREKLETGKEAFLYTYLNVREDAMMLFGFYTAKEYDLFLQLIGVSGIGPKVALNILSKITPDEFYFSVSQKRIDPLTKIPGVGKKTAERIILELKDKIKSDEIELETTGSAFSSASVSYAEQDAVAALTALGYNQSESATAVRKISSTKNAPEHSVQELIKLALKELTKR
ncbi:MAG: Holliday junction branch migration protein RuvA [Sporomusaceae bacterium]|jgi:Holliday junction DNA helicase RuvA|nr:Holliday junction branch migration protein RuvA [Sporomusaceae bacterium]